MKGVGALYAQVLCYSDVLGVPRVTELVTFLTWMVKSYQALSGPRASFFQFHFWLSAPTVGARNFFFYFPWQGKKLEV